MVDTTAIEGRATGKSFRSICESLRLASEGKNIVFVSHNGPDADRSFKIARDMVIAGRVDPSVVIKKTQRRINFPEGFILFISQEIYVRDRFTGMMFTQILDI